MGRFTHALGPLRVAICASLVAVVGIVGCGKSSPTSPNNSQNSEPNAASNAPTEGLKTEAEAAPGPGQKTCFACEGAGIVSCHAPGCVGGKVDCPAPCLKLTKGTWIHMNVAGHSPNELWQKFPNSGGRGGYQAWNQNHVGEVVVMQNGEAVNIGPCKTCGGATKVECRVCKGQGKQTCEICSGKKFIPTAWTPTDNPWFNRQPDLIRLKDGRVLLGQVAASNGDEKMIRLRDGKVVHVKTADIVTKPGASSP